jgi:hypothetical protein
MSSRIRFTAARQIFEAFPIASDDIATVAGDEDPLSFARKLLHSKQPFEAIAFCAYLLPRRETVWWACQCVRAMIDPSGEEAALKAAEAWVREPEEATRRAALDLGATASKRAATTWLASAAGWSGGNMTDPSPIPVTAPPYLTAKAAMGALSLALAKVGALEQPAWIFACAEAGIRFAEGGDARPRVTAARPQA